MLVNINTKKKILDELRSRKINWAGNLEEVNFINRLTDISQLPSNDPRFIDMSGDIWQHRVNNPTDWEDEWIYSDNRINLLENDDLFIKFICEMLHPIVRDAKEAQELKKMMNFYLRKDGFQIVEDEQFYGLDNCSFKCIQINPTQIEKNFKTKDEFVHEAYEKMDKRLREEDYSGAVTSARTLIEDAIKDIYYQITGDNLDKIENLQDGYKKIQKFLKLDFDPKIDESRTSLLRSFVTIISTLAPIINSMADRHATKLSAQRNSVLLCTDTSKIFVNFLYGRLNEIHGLYPNIYDKLLKILDSDLRMANTDSLLKELEIKQCLQFCDEYTKIIMINKLIENYDIYNFRSGDIFFAFLRIFSSTISEPQLFRIVEKHKNNKQTAGIDLFLAELHEINPTIFTERINKVIKDSKFIGIHV